MAIRISHGTENSCRRHAAFLLATTLIIGLAGCALRGIMTPLTSAPVPAQGAPEANATPVRPVIRPPEKSNAFGGIWAWCGATPDKRLTNLLPILYVRNRDYGHPAAMARASQQLPSGRAAIFLWNAAPNLLSSPQDTCRTPEDQPTKFPSPWLSVGAAKIQERMATFFRRYKAAGGKLNFLVLDYEAGLTSWELTLPVVKAIERDPRCTELTARLGFSYLSSIFFAGPNRRQWNLQMGQRVAKALNTGFFQPARMVFPAVEGSNFNGIDMRAPYIVPDLNDHFQPCACVVGNCQSPALYGEIGGLAYASPGGRPYGQTPFAVLRYEVLYLQGVEHSSTLPVVPWVAYRHYGKMGEYYKELIYQSVLRGVNHFLYFNPRQKDGATFGDDQYLNNLLAVLKNRLGSNPGAPVTTRLVNWNSRLLVAGRHCTDGQIRYRLSVPPGVREVEELPNGRLINMNARTGVWLFAGAGKTFRIVNSASQ